MTRLLFAVFVVSASCLTLALMGRGVSFHAFGTRVSAESVSRLIAIAAVTGTAWLVMRTIRRPRALAAPAFEQSAPTRLLARVWLVGSIVLVMSVCIGIAGSLRAAPQLRPSGDAALMEIGALNALEGAQRVGPYSRFGWNHPGPLAFYLLAPWYALAREHSLGLSVGGLFVNLLAIVMAGWVALRHRSLSFAVAVASALAFLAWRFAPLLTSAWNPHLILLPVAALLVLAAAVAAGDSMALPGLALMASVTAQSHVGVLPLVGIVSATASIAWAAQGSWRTTMGSWRWVALALALLCLAWALPAYDELSRGSGNFSRLSDFFGRTGVLPPQAWSHALAVWGDVLTAGFRSNLRLPSGGGFEPHTSMAMSLLCVGVLAAVAGGAWLMRRRSPALAWLGALSVVAAVMALLSVAGIRGDVTDYSVFWISVAGALNGAFIVGMSLDLLVAERQKSVGTPLVAATALSVPLLIAVGYGGRHLAHIEAAAAVDSSLRSEIGLLADRVESLLHATGSDRARVNIASNTWAEAAGLILELRKRGTTVRVEPGLDIMYGRMLAREPDGDELTIWVVDRPLGTQFLQERGGCIAAEAGHVLLYTSDVTTGCEPAGDEP